MLDDSTDQREPIGCRVVAVLTLGVFSISCATLTAPVRSGTGAATEKSLRNDSKHRPLQLDALEGRPTGLVLHVRSRRSVEPGRRLELHRSSEGTGFEVRRRAELTPEAVARLTDGGIRLVDRKLEPGHSYRYRVQLAPARDESGPLRSPTIEIEWRQPPPRPDRFSVRATSSQTVELRWHPSSRGAAIFRRRISPSQRTERRIADPGPESDGVYVDREVRPGRVYAYRVALADRREAFIQYGPPSTIRYVSVPGNRQGTGNGE